MRLTKQSRKKRGSVAPMSDDEDSSSSGALHLDSPNPPRQASRGVSFSTSRGKIWLILIANLAIVTSFIFMGSSRVPVLNGEGMVKEALEQDQPHPGPVIKNSEHGLFEGATVTKEPQIQESGGYTKLTRTDEPKAQDEDRESETKAPLVNDYVNERAIEENNDNDEETKPVAAVIEQTPTPTNDDTSSGFTSNVPSDGEQSPAGSTDQESQSEPEPLNKVEDSSITSTAEPRSEDIELSAVESEVVPKLPAFQDNLAVWLASDSGVEVNNLAACMASSGQDLAACEVNSWTSQIASTDPTAAGSAVFIAALPQQKPLWVPVVSDTHNQFPTVQFSCPMTTDALKLHESMTLLFVLSPAQIETGAFARQKFFGNSPYGQFALHGGKPSFFANNGLVEHTHTLPAGQFSLVTYRLHQHYVEIKANGGPWGGQVQEQGGTAGTGIRITVNEVVSLGNSKSACDTNAFHGRIAELLVYDVVLDDAKVEIVEKYLHDKWWGNKSFPETAVPVASTADPEASTAEAPNDNTTTTSLAANPVDHATEVASVAPEVDQQVVTQEPSPTDKSLAEATEQTSTAKGALVTQSDHRSHNGVHDAPVKEAEDGPKFDPRVNIFEWTPPTDADAAKATQWNKTVKDKVSYIRNFQLGGDVLRTLIREHKDELIALREELFA